MKKLVILLLITLMMLSVMACNSQEPKDDNSTQKPSASDPATSDLNSNTGETPDNNSEDPNLKEFYCEPEEALFYADTVSGYSIRSTYSYGSYGDSYVINKNGYINFVLPENEISTTKIYNGYFLSRDKQKNITYVRDINGEIIISDEMLNGAKILVDNNYTLSLSYSNKAIESMFKDGYILIYKITESYNGVKYEIGFMNTKGNWIVNLSEQNPILKTEMEISEDSLKDKFNYAGDGILQFGEWLEKNYFYNILENATYLIDSTIDSEIIGTNFKFEYIKFNNDVYRYIFGEDVYTVNKKGKITKSTMKIHSSISKSHFETEEYYSKQEDKFIFIGKERDSEKYVVADSKANIIKTFSDVEIIDFNGFLENGTCQLKIKNNEGSIYYTVINIKGEFLFDPVKVSDDANVGLYDIYGNGMDTNQGYEKFVVVNDKGEIVLSETTESHSIKNGIAYYSIKNGSNSRESFYVKLPK